jgi:hypothetical protein
MQPYQYEATSLAPPYGIVHTDDPRKKKRRNANSTSPRLKRKPSLSNCYECLIMDTLFRLSIYVR